MFGTAISTWSTSLAGSSAPRLSPELLDIQRKTPETCGTCRRADTWRAGGQEADGTVLTTEAEVRDPLDGMIRRCIPALLVVAVTTLLTTVSYLVVPLYMMLVYDRVVARGHFGKTGRATCRERVCTSW